MGLTEGQVLFHGSYAPIREIDLSACAPGKDFGRGFYLSPDFDQACNFIKTSLKKAQGLGKISVDQAFGFVSAFRFSSSQHSLSVYEFPGADDQWLWFVSLNRRASLAELLKSKIDDSLWDADVVIGKIANDRTNPVITAYLNGLYGPIGGSESVEIAKSLLLPDRLKDQYCFRTERAVSCLEPLEVVRYEL